MDGLISVRNDIWFGMCEEILKMNVQNGQCGKRIVWFLQIGEEDEKNFRLFVICKLAFEWLVWQEKRNVLFKLSGWLWQREHMSHSLIWFFFPQRKKMTNQKESYEHAWNITKSHQHGTNQSHEKYHSRQQEIKKRWKR